MKEEAKGKGDVLRKLFFSCLYLSTFTFGGGYVIVTLMKKKFVDQYHWIDDEEMLDLIAIAQSSPGAIAVNGAIVVGYKLAGIPGVSALCPRHRFAAFCHYFHPFCILRCFPEQCLDTASSGRDAIRCCGCHRISCL